jgi:hypothetical protein
MNEFIIKYLHKIIKIRPRSRIFFFNLNRDLTTVLSIKFAELMKKKKEYKLI